MLSMGKSMLVYGKVDPVEETYRKIESVSAANLMDLANEVFNPSQLSSLRFSSNI
jgi:predicted Zn-dependent peptidase